MLLLRQSLSYRRLELSDLFSVFCEGLPFSSSLSSLTLPSFSSLLQTPNHHQLPKPLTLAKLRPPQRMVAVGSRIDLGSPYIPSCVINSRLICLSDGSDVRSYQLELSPGKQVLVHHVFSKEGGGGLVVPNRALDAMQKRKVPLERMWNDGTTKTRELSRLRSLPRCVNANGSFFIAICQLPLVSPS